MVAISLFLNHLMNSLQGGGFSRPSSLEYLKKVHINDSAINSLSNI